MYIIYRYKQYGHTHTTHTHIHKYIYIIYCTHTHRHTHLHLHTHIHLQSHFHHTPKVRNKNSCEAPSFHTSGTPRNVPYTILTWDHMCISRGMAQNDWPPKLLSWVQLRSSWGPPKMRPKHRTRASGRSWPISVKPNARWDMGYHGMLLKNMAGQIWG